MIKLHNTNNNFINYFIDETYAHAFMKRNDLLDLYKSGIVVMKNVRQEEILNEIFNFAFFVRKVSQRTI